MTHNTAYDIVHKYHRAWTSGDIDTSRTTAPAAEYFIVADGRIASSVLIFDRLSYGPPDQG